MPQLAYQEAVMERTLALPDVHVAVTQRPRGAVVHIDGKLGWVEADSLGVPLLRLMAQRCPLVVFELSGLRSVSSLAVAALEEFRRGLERWGGKVALAAPRPAVLAAFEQSGLGNRFPVFADAEEALEWAA